MSFTWKEEYAVGVRIIDEQHKVLLELLNDLDQVRKNPEAAATKRSGILQRLENYTKVHFTTEEEIMRIYGVKDFETHKAMHAKFAEKVQAFNEFYNDDKMFLFENVYTYLEGWLLKHIQVEDKKLGPYLNSQGLS